MTTMSSIVADLSKQPCPMVTYFPMIVAAESPVGDVLQMLKTAINNTLFTCIYLASLPGSAEQLHSTMRGAVNSPDLHITPLHPREDCKAGYDVKAVQSRTLLHV